MSGGLYSAGDYDISGTTLNTTTSSSLPFIQQMLCTLIADTNQSVPFGTVAYFAPSVNQCPVGWNPFTEGEGRSLIGGYDSKGVCVL